MKRFTPKILLSLLLATTAVVPAFAADLVQENRYQQEIFVANKSAYNPHVIDKKLVNGWGIAIRPAGAGGHFWVTGGNTSFEYVGDVKNSPDAALRTLHVDDLKYVDLPVGGKDNFATGTVFNDSKENFVISQDVAGAETITAPAKFLFASDGGIISAWTERKKPDGSFDRPAKAISVIDQSADGVQFFGLAISHDYHRLYAADFGKNPMIRTYDGQFNPVDLVFDTPFDSNKNGMVDPGEYAPFNIQALKTPNGDNHLFVTYAKTQPCPKDAVKERACVKDALFVGEEDTSQPGYGRVAEFTEDGKLVAIWPDDGRLSAPWGIAFAPDDFGALSDALLVGNFGDGQIAAYDAKTRQFIDFIKDSSGNPVKIDKLWGFLFGNGQSLGDKNALYFAAGPDDEKDGLFGSLRPVSGVK